MTKRELIQHLYWQRDQFSRYVVVFSHDEWSRTGAVDRLDIANSAIHLLCAGKVKTKADWIALQSIVRGNDGRLEDMRAAIIRMPDTVWREIEAEL